MLIIEQEKCLACGGCVPLCPAEALLLSSTELICDQGKCSLCGACIQFCPVGAIGESRAIAV